MSTHRAAVMSTTAVVFANLLLGCVTPPGQLTDADFDSRTLDIQQSVPQSVSSFYDGFRHCGPISGAGLFKVAHGAPECGPPRPDGTAICDIYVGTSKASTGVILGRADFQPSQSGTLVVLRIQKRMADKQEILGTWEKFVYGQARLACPAK
jgi:hypothetical protein